MILVDGRGHLPEPKEAVFRGPRSSGRRLLHVFGRFVLLVLAVFFMVGNLPEAARVLLDPLGATGPGGASPDIGALDPWALGLPVALVGLAWVLAATQRSFAFQGRRIALRKQAWALYREFQESIDAALDADEQPVAFRMADPPELSTSLLLRLGIFWLSLVVCLLAVVIPLALRIHWPEAGQAAWYHLTLTLTAVGLVTLWGVRTPPVLRLFIQSAIPALHFGHGLMLGTSTLTPLGLPAMVLDTALGLASGVLAYRLGQLERGGCLLVFTTKGLRAFDPAGRTTRELWRMTPLEELAWRETPAGVMVELAGGGTRRSLAFESAEDAAEVPELLATKGIQVQGRPQAGHAGALTALLEPGVLGWALLLGLGLVVGREGHLLVTRQALLARHLLPHLPAWGAGEPGALLEGARAALARDRDFYPARVMEALALVDQGEDAAATVALAKLPPDDDLHGFAARVLPPRRARLARLAAIASETPDAAARARAQARFLLTEVRGPGTADVALARLAETDRSPARDFLEGLAGLQGAAVDMAEVEARLGASPERRFLRVGSALSRGDEAAALEAAAEHGELAGLAGPLGRELARVVTLRYLGACQRAPALLPRAQAFVEAARATIPDADPMDLELALLGAALLPEADAARALEALRTRQPQAFLEDAPGSLTLGRVLAEEAAGHRDWAQWAAYQACGVEVVRLGDPAQVGLLRGLPPLARRYVAGLALTGMGRDDLGHEWLADAAGHPDFPWPRWAKARGLLSP